MALRVLRELTCKDKCKIVARWRNRCNSSYPCSNNVLESEVVPLLGKRYVAVPPVIISTLVSLLLTGLSAPNITQKRAVPARS